MLTIGELFCCCVLRQFLMFVEVFRSEMFVFFLDCLLSVSVKFLFLCARVYLCVCVCVCVCICLSVCLSVCLSLSLSLSCKKAEQIFIQFSNNLYCAITVDTQYTFLLWNSPPLNWVSFIIFEKVPIENHPHDDDDDDYDDETKQYPLLFFFFFSNSFFGLLSLQFSVFVERMSGNWFSGLLGHDYIFLLICHKENTSIVVFLDSWVFSLVGL